MSELCKCGHHKNYLCHAKNPDLCGSYEPAGGEAHPAAEQPSHRIELLQQTYYGRNCPKGMVQVEFVGCDPKEMYSKYGWKPTIHAFIEVYVDGDRFRIDVGDIHDGHAQRRGLHIVTDKLNLHTDKTAMNAASVWIGGDNEEPR